jgi:hypothetical protein
VVGTEFESTWVDQYTGIKNTEILVRTVLTGEAPCYEGSRFLARVEWNEGSPIIQTAPGVEVEGGIDRSVLVDGYCAHCNTSRARKNTYIVERDGAQVQIGSSCIKDFLGWTALPVWIDTNKVGSDIEEGFGGRMGQADQSFTPLSILTNAWAAIRAFGWVAASSYDGGMKTREWVSFALGASRLPQHRPQPGTLACMHCDVVEGLAKFAPFAAEAGPEAERVLAFILSDDFSGNSEYVQNLKTVAAASQVSQRFLGLLVSAPQAYAKFLNDNLIKKAKAEKPSNWVGEIKQRLVLEALTIENINYIEGDYGTTTLYTFRQAATGNIFKWFASNEAFGDQKGITVTLKATVKKHEDFRGTKTTTLTRAVEVSA